MAQVNKMFRKRKKAMTIAELMVTTILIGVLAIVGYSTLSSVNEQQNAKTGIDKIAYAVKRAKQLARNNGVIATLSFNVNSNKYDIKLDGVSIIDENSYGVTNGNLAEDITIISNNCYSMGFDVDGSLIDEWGYPIYYDCEIVVGYSDGPKETIKVKGKTGVVNYD